MSVIMLTLFPILLILVLGNALSSMMSNDDVITRVKAAYVSQSEHSDLYEFMISDEISPYVDIAPCSIDQAKEMLDAEEVSVIISEHDGEVNVTQRSEHGRSSTIVLSIVESYRQIHAAAEIAAKDGRNPMPSLDAQIQVQNTATGGRTYSALDYYAITMLVMILLYTGMNGMSLFQKNMLGQFGQRLQGAPLSRGTVVCATMAASTVTSFLQGMVTFIFSATVYGVDWGSRIPLVLLTLFAVTLFSQALCVFLLLVFKSDGACTGIVQAMFWIFTFVSKGYTNIDFGSAEKIFQFAPNAMAHTVIFGAIYGGDESFMMLSLCLLFAVSIVLSLGAFLLGRRRLV